MRTAVDCHLSADTWWPQCVAMAAARRAGTRTAHAAAWTADAGWTPAGPWDADAMRQFSLLKPVLDAEPGGAPWVIGQLGQSLDGCVATHTGDSCFISGDPSLQHLHRLRALCDAVIVGAGTVARDNPRLTTRRVAGAHPVRVVIDPQLRLPLSATVFADDTAPTAVVCDARLHAQATARHGAARVVAIAIAISAGTTTADGPAHIDPAAIVRALHQRGLQVLLVEGGGVTVSRFLDRGCLDRLHLTVSPVLIGSGRPGLQLPARSGAMADCPRPASAVHQLGVDVLWDIDLRNPMRA